MGEIALRTGSKRARLLGVLVGVALVVLVFGGFVLVQRLRDAGSGTPPTAANVPPVVTAAGLEQRSGVRVVHVALTGAGGLVDLRFQVVDSNKAASIHNSSTPPELVDEATGAVVDKPFMGHTHKGVLKVGQTYYMIFENPGNLVQRGGKVTVVLGNARLPHVVVQ